MIAIHLKLFGKACTHVEHSLHTRQKKTGHNCSNKSLSIDIKQTPISWHLSVWTGLNVKIEFLNKAWEFFWLVHLGTLPVLDILYMSQPLTDRLKKASKIKILLFEQERHVVLQTVTENKRQANLSLAFPNLAKGKTWVLLHWIWSLPILWFLTKQKTV